MREVILKALELAKAIAAATPNTVDDRLIEIVDKILGNPAILDIVVDLIDRWLGGPDPLMALDSANAGLTPEAVSELDQAGIDIPTILMIIRLVMEIIEKWRKR